MKHYYIMHGYENDPVVPDKQDLSLYEKGVITDKGFAVNYEVKLRSQEAYDWMERVSREAIHEDVVLIGEEKGIGKNCRTMLAKMMTSMFGGKMNFRYIEELK